MATRRRISTHFTVEEFDCRDGRRVPREAIPGLIDLAERFLEPARQMFGPVTITGPYRHRDYNASIGGAADSRHVYDRHPRSPAADFRCARGRPREWRDLLDDLGAGALGLYPSFVHVDDRRGRARW